MYYSQHGEDYILDQVFKDKKNGFFVEVGCVDGRRFSNTLSLEERGWDGVNIEAHADYISLLKQNRKCAVVHAAVCEVDGGTISFYADRRGSLSSLDKSREVELHRDYAEYFSGFTEQIVPQRTLTSIFSELEVDTIDVLSLDIEGGEEMALEGLDFDLYRPTVLVIEFGSLRNLRDLKTKLSKYGYGEALIIKNNIFLSTDPALFTKVQKVKHAAVSLLHTGNPFDGESDQEKSVIIDTRFFAYYKNLWKFVEKKLRHLVKNIIRKYD